MTLLRTSPLLALAGFLGACAPFHLKEPPAGFAEVSQWKGNARMKSGDDVGINITSFDNVKGGTLAFWAEDMIEKLGRRGYVLEKQTPAKARNGVVGTRFDFSYETPTEHEKKFFTAVLFVSDKRRVVVQLAGAAELAGKHGAHVDEVASEISVRGCRGPKICRGPQPGPLSTAGLTEPPVPSVPEPVDGEPVDEPPVEPVPGDGAAGREAPAKEEPAKEKPATEKPAKEKPAKEKPAKEKPAKEKPAAE